MLELTEELKLEIADHKQQMTRGVSYPETYGDKNVGCALISTSFHITLFNWSQH
jgi:hypothetical protein